VTENPKISKKNRKNFLWEIVPSYNTDIQFMTRWGTAGRKERGTPSGRGLGCKKAIT
jgi:hypothetical protein